MVRFNREKYWWLAGVALVALLVAQVGSPLAESGREFSRCIQACNETRKACGSACQEDCRALYPDGGAVRDECIAECKVDCNSNSDECKQVCQNIKNPPSPEEP